ncbi:MAG TPA: hypothetical protein VFZ78_10220 [Flavisolibacter sp.]
MEDLFSTSLAVDNRSINYHVVFDHEKYVFRSAGSEEEFRTFSFRREHDEWVDQEKLPPDLRQQAIDALEKYLLKQH